MMSKWTYATKYKINVVYNAKYSSGGLCTWLVYELGYSELCEKRDMCDMMSQAAMIA